MKTNRLNNLLLLIIILLLMLVCINYYKFKYSYDLYLFLVGLGLLIAFKTKKIIKPLIFGLFFVFIAIIMIFSNFFPPKSIIFLCDSMFFIIPGIVLLFVFPHSNLKKVIIPSSFLIFTGLYLVLYGILSEFMSSYAYALLFIIFILFVITNILTFRYIRGVNHG